MSWRGLRQRRGGLRERTAACGAARQLAHISRGTDSNDSFAANRDRLGPRVRRVGGKDLPASENDVRAALAGGLCASDDSRGGERE